MLKHWLIGRLAIVSIFTLSIVCGLRDNVISQENKVSENPETDVKTSQNPASIPTPPVTPPTPPVPQPPTDQAIPGWQDIPFTPVKLGTLPKEIPVFGPFPREYKTIPKGQIPVPQSAVYQLLEERWKMLFTMHPVQEVRETWALVEAGNIQVGLIADENIFAFVFHPPLIYADIPEGTNKDTAVYKFSLEEVKKNIEDCKNKLMPTFFLSIGRLFRADGQEYVARLMLGLYHEYKHYKETEELKTFEERKEWSDQHSFGFLKVKIDMSDGKITEWDYPFCDELWKSENSAYFAESSLGASWGQKDSLGMVERTSNKAAFDQLFFKHADKFFGIQLPGNSIRHCVVNWARLAGHPNPQGFIPQ